MPALKRQTPKPTARKPEKHAVEQAKTAATLPESMITGKARPAKAAEGDKPVFAYIASLNVGCVDTSCVRARSELQADHDGQ